MKKSISETDYRQYINSFNSFENIETINTAEEDAAKIYEKLKQKLREFDSVKSVQAAKKLASKLFDIKNEINYIKAGTGRCVIISRANLLRVVLSNDAEVICYNFGIKKENNNE